MKFLQQVQWTLSCYQLRQVVIRANVPTYEEPPLSSSSGTQWFSVKIFYNQNSTTHVSNWSTVSASLSHLLSSADSVAVLRIRYEVSTASAMNSFVLPVAPGGLQGQMYERIKNHLCPRHRGANGSQNAGLTFNHRMWLVTRRTFTAVLLMLDWGGKKTKWSAKPTCTFQVIIKWKYEKHS